MEASHPSQAASTVFLRLYRTAATISPRELADMAADWSAPLCIAASILLDDLGDRGLAHAEKMLALASRVSVDPKTRCELMRRLARCRLKMGDAHGSLRALEGAMSYDASRSDIKSEYALIVAFLGQWPAAASVLEDVPEPRGAAAAEDGWTSTLRRVLAERDSVGGADQLLAFLQAQVESRTQRYFRAFDPRAMGDGNVGAWTRLLASIRQALPDFEPGVWPR
ncbi:MAG: hypothetical protein LJF04_15095 [Gemmatimonadetes bacterium]|nr:hypothetical protein [Gemmatimonadota bacterium]